MELDENPEFQKKPCPVEMDSKEDGLLPHLRTSRRQSVAQIKQMPQSYGKESQFLQCPKCNESIETDIRKRPSRKAFLMGLGLLFVGLWCGCCLIPCFKENLQDCEHSCPQCRKVLGKYRA